MRSLRTNFERCEEVRHVTNIRTTRSRIQIEVRFRCLERFETLSWKLLQRPPLFNFIVVHFSFAKHFISQKEIFMGLSRWSNSKTVASDGAPRPRRLLHKTASGLGEQSESDSSASRGYLLSGGQRPPTLSWRSEPSSRTNRYRRRDRGEIALLLHWQRESAHRKSCMENSRWLKLTWILLPW